MAQWAARDAKAAAALPRSFHSAASSQIVRVFTHSYSLSQPPHARPEGGQCAGGAHALLCWLTGGQLTEAPHALCSQKVLDKLSVSRGQTCLLMFNRSLLITLSCNPWVDRKTGVAKHLELSHGDKHGDVLPQAHHEDHDHVTELRRDLLDRSKHAESSARSSGV